MFKNYFKTAWRNLTKDKQFSLLNLIGLSTGLACALLIWLWVSNELSVDKFNSNDSRLYQVLKQNPDATGAIQIDVHTQGLLAPSMADQLPEIETATRVVKQRDLGILSFDDKRFKAKSEFADKNFFKVFSYKLIAGNENNQLSNISGILLSDRTALKLFNSTDVIGKTIKWNFKDDDVDFTNVYMITGVFKSPPSNASDQFDVLLPFDLYAQKNAGNTGDISNWGSNMASTYIVLKKGVDINAFNKKIKDYTRDKFKSLYSDKTQLDYLLKWEGTLFAQKYSDRYLYNHYANGVVDGGRIEYVKLFSIIAIFILLIACINFMNLSTAKATKRVKEVGIKKVVGASRRSLIFQYLSESILLAFASLVIAIVIAIVLLPAFRDITGKEIDFQFHTNIILVALSITLITGLLAGSYPALYLSGFRPALVLKGTFPASSGESWIRKGLVVFQFSISVILIIAVVIIYQQMKLIQTTNLGYNKDNILTFSNDGNLATHLSPFLADLKKIPGVVNASSQSGNFLGNASHGGGGINWEGKDPNLGIEYYGNDVGDDFFETMGLRMSEGRPFNKAFADSSSVIFNETAIRQMGLKNPIGKIVSLWGQKKQIVGVVKDYHFNSLHDKITPAFLVYDPNAENTLVKIKAGSERQTTAAIKSLYRKYNNGLDFTYSFLDDDYNKLYASEQRVAVLSKYFAGIAILISCLGLFGLAAFTAQKRQKEIGIRKVIGASVSNILAMLSKDFLMLVLIALCVALPVSWWAANKWLQSFAYRINISPLVFLIAGLSVILITLFTISFQSIKAAIANPVDSLRSE